jgi:hypothetical protein
MQNGSAPSIPETRNPDRGFLGTLRQHADANEARSLASHAISSATGRSDEAVRDFLDSRYGREFGDAVASALVAGQDLRAAIATTVMDWTERLIDGTVEDELGIPQGLPYLAGLVCMHEAFLEMSG